MEKKFIYVLIFLSLLLIQSCNLSNKVNDKNEIGVVNFQKIKRSKTYKELEKNIENLKKDFQQKIEEFEKSNKSENLNLKYFLKTNFEEKKEKLQNEFKDKLIKAIYYTANKEKIGLVISYEAMPYGGIDITEKVVQNLDKGNIENYPSFNNVRIISYIDKNSLKDYSKIKQIIKQIYQEKEIFVVIDKQNVFLGGLDLNEEFQKNNSFYNTPK